MENDFYSQELRQEQSQETLTLGRYTAKTFLLMFLGLLVTFGTALFFSETIPGFYVLYMAATYIPALHLILLIAELIVVVAMTAGLQKLSPGGAMACFLLYSFITGLTFCVIFLMYELSSLILVFGATALYFGGMAVFGYVTHMDLARLRPILLGGLIFLIIMNVLMLFIPGLEAADRIMCTIGVIIFLAYTAYDTQKIRKLYTAFSGDEAMLKKASIYSALELYLDFINIFLYLLRFLGKNRRN